MTRGAIGRAVAIMSMFAGALSPDGGPLIQDDQHARQIGSRFARAEASRVGGTMGLAQLDRWAGQRRRARQTHPGKRGKS